MEETIEGGFRLRGYTRWEHRRNGDLIDLRELSNLVMTVGRTTVAGIINAYTTYHFTYLAIGTSTAAVTTADVLLTTEITTTSGGALRGTGTVGTTNGTLTGDTAVWYKTWTFSTEHAAGYAVGESAIFASSSSGPMLAKQVFAPINVVGNDTLTVTWKVLTSATC